MSVIYTVDLHHAQRKQALQDHIRYLIENKLSTDLERYIGNPEVDWWQACSVAIHQENLTIVRFLMENTPIDKNKVDSDGSSLVSKACSNMNKDVLKYLLEIGCDPNGPTDQFTNTGFAIVDSDLHTFKLLLKHKADPNAEEKGHCMLRLAASMGCTTEFMQALLEAGADPNPVLPVTIAETNVQKYDFIRMLLAYGAKTDGLVAEMKSEPESKEILYQIKLAREIGVSDKAMMLYPNSTFQTLCIAALSKMPQYEPLFEGLTA